MKNTVKTRASKLFVAAALAGLGFASTASASLLVDVRAISVTNASGASSLVNGKSVTLGQGDSVTVGIFLSGLETETGGTNGLGSFSASVRSLGEAPTSGNADGMLQATASTNGQSNPPFDFAYSTGSVADSTLVADADTDNDIVGIGGTQLDGGAPYQPGIGNGTEISLGTATFQASNAAQGLVNLNTYFNGTSGAAGGLVIKALTSAATDDTNGVSATNAASAAKIGTNIGVNVVPAPEPASIGLLGIAGLSLLKRRRNA